MPTIVASKSAFLRSQINGILSQPLQISPDTAAQKAPDIPMETLQEAISEVNRVVNQHYAAAYFPLAIRAVAQQIDQLYWDEAEPAPRGADEDADGVRENEDLASSHVISQLPDTLGGSSEYTEYLAQLRQLDTRRSELKQKLEKLQQMQKLLEPFRHPQESVQANLVTKDGLLEKQLGELRSLALRVSAKLADRPSTGFNDDSMAETEIRYGDDMEIDFDETTKLRSLMRLPD